jgi:hypothetical protein
MDTEASEASGGNYGLASHSFTNSDDLRNSGSGKTASVTLLISRFAGGQLLCLVGINFTGTGV